MREREKLPPKEKKVPAPAAGAAARGRETEPPDGFCDPRALAGLPADAPLAVAFSGGPDSVALLSMLAAPGTVAVHVHHGLRGEEADRDEAFCRRTAERLGVPLTVLRLDVRRLAAESGESLETAARSARYHAIASFMRANGIPLLVTAHQADDQLETMLQHLLRGSGLRGLSGIPVCRPLEGDLMLARPLLSVSRAELLSYLDRCGLSYVTDSTNREPCCQRNVLRLRVIPQLEALRPGAALRAAQCARALAEDEAYLDGLAADFLHREGDCPTVSGLLSLPRPVFVRVMRRILPEAPTAVHLSAIGRLLRGGKPHARLSLPPACVLRIEGGRLCVDTAPPRVCPPYRVFLSPGENRIGRDDALVLLGSDAAIRQTQGINVYKYSTQMLLPSVIMKGKIFARQREPGDVILRGGMHRAVRRLPELSFLPPEVRARMPILCDGEGVLAVPFCGVRDGAGNPDLPVAVFFN